MGEHSLEVARAVAKLSESQVQALQAAGVFT
jgi:hypothetical protein